MISLIDRYISKLFLTYLAAGIIVFLTLRVTADAAGTSVQYNVPVNVLIEYYLYSLPSFLYQMIPMGCLIACIFTLGTMSRSNELTALFSTGMSLARISAPILVLVAIVSAGSFVAGDWLIPVFEKKKKYIEYVDIKKQPGLYSTVKTNKIWYRSGNILFNLKTLVPEKKMAQTATFYYFDDQWNLVQLITAQVIHFREHNVWELEDGTVTIFVEESSFPLTKSFKTKTVTIDEELGDLSKQIDAADTLRITELSKFIKRNKEAGLDTVQYEVDLQAKYSFAFAGLVMSFLSIPFSVGRGRSGGWALGAGICLGLAFLYWSLHSSGITLGKHGVVPPFLAVWSPNILMLLVGLFFLVRLKR
jgi:lipopolysaccharide export system permease protein